MTRAAVYVRLSQDTPETTSPARQREACEKLIADRGWDYNRDHDLYEDVDFSAWTGKTRPAFTRLRDQLANYDAVVYWKLDRLARNVLEYAEFMRDCERRGVTLVAVVEGEVDTDSPTGRAMSQVSAVFAELESATTSLRIRASQEHLARTGRWKGGRTPYGYRSAPHPDGGRTLEVDPDQADRLRQMARKVIAGESTRAVAAWLNESGVPPAGGGIAWSVRAVLNMLRNPRNLGYAIHHGEPVTDDDGLPLVVFEPILDRDTYDALQRALSSRSRRQGRPRTGATLLSGLIVCGKCGGGMAGWNADDPRASYACWTYSTVGKAGCDGNAVKRRYADEVVTDAVLQVLRPASLAELYASARRRRDRLAPDRDQARIGQLEDALDRLERDRVELGLYDDEEGRRRYAAQFRRLAGELQEVRDRIRSTSRPTVLDVLPGPDVNVPDEWGGWPRSRKRAILGALIERVVVGPWDGVRGRFNPARISIVWHD